MARNFSIPDRQNETGPALSYTDTGTGNDTKGILVFLHGLMMSKEVWDFQVNYFSDKYRTIAIDLAGFGQSSHAAARNSYAEHAQDVHELLQRNRITRAHLVGWSMGACVAINFAELFPSALSTLTLVNASPKVVRVTDFPWSVESDMLIAMMGDLESNPGFMAEKFVGQILSGCTDKALHKKILTIVNNTKPEVAMSHIRLAIQCDLRVMLSNIQAPTLLINGELDIFSPALANEYMVRQIKKAEWIEIPETGHAPFLTEQVTFNTHLEHFLQQPVQQSQARQIPER